MRANIIIARIRENSRSVSFPAGTDSSEVYEASVNIRAQKLNTDLCLVGCRRRIKGSKLFFCFFRKLRKNSLLKQHPVGDPLQDKWCCLTVCSVRSFCSIWFPLSLCLLIVSLPPISACRSSVPLQSYLLPDISYGRLDLILWQIDALFNNILQSK